MEKPTMAAPSAERAPISTPLVEEELADAALEEASPLVVVRLGCALGDAAQVVYGDAEGFRHRRRLKKRA